MTLLPNAGTAALDIDDDLIRIDLPDRVAMLSITELLAMLPHWSIRQIPARDEDGLQIGWLVSQGGDGATLEITETGETFALTKSRLLDLMCGATETIGISQFVRGAAA